MAKFNQKKLSSQNNSGGTVSCKEFWNLQLMRKER